MPLAHNTLTSAAFTVSPRPRSTAVTAAALRIIGPPQFLHGGLTASISNCVIELRSSVYPGEPLRPRPLDVRVSATLQNAPTPMGPDTQRDVAGYLAMARRTILTTAEADQRNIRSAGLRTPAGPRLRTWV